MLQNASPLETGWTLVHALGAALALALLFLSVRDEIRRRRYGVDGVVRLDVQKSIAVALGLVLALGGFAVAGLVSMQIPSRPDAAVDPGAALSAYLLPVIFILVGVVLIGLTVYCLLQREAINREISDAVRRNRRATDRVEAPS